MTNSQLYLAIGVPLVVNFGLIFVFYKVLRDNTSDRFTDLYKYLDTRFTSIDNQLKFLVDHTVDNIQRIASLEAKVK